MKDEKPFLPPEADLALRRMPKCSLHTHLEGAVRPTTWWELAQAQGFDVGVGREEAEALLQVDGSERSLVDYLAKISRTYPVLKDREALRRTAFEAAEDAALDGVIYFELRAGPMTHTRPGLSVEEVIVGLLEGLWQAEERFGLVCRLIVSALRHHPPEDNVRLAHAAVGFVSDGVVGFDLAGDEAGFPAQLHAEAFAIAREGGLGITVHAGEAGGAENVDYAVQELGASRIGHGVHSVESEATVGMLEKRAVLLEVCPTSNVHTGAVLGIAAHPVRYLYDRGIPISIGDDDPTTSRTHLSNELTLVRDRFGFSQEEMAGIQRTSLEAAFLNGDDVRARLGAVLSHGGPRVDSG
jgi:adenosine deaminase